MRNILTLFSLLTVSGLCAQVTLSYNMLSQTGVSMEMYVVSDPGTATTPSDGANQTWDFSSVTLLDMGDLDFTPAAGTPYAASYPSANWAWAQTVTGFPTQYAYMNITTAVLQLIATDVPSDANPYSDPKDLLRFPLSLGQSFTDSYADLDGPASVTWSYTGHGTMITPLGTFSNIVKMVSSEGDLLLWNTNPLHPMVIDDGSMVLVFGPGMVGIDEQASRDLQVHPNPCSDNLVVQDAGIGAQWTITDTQGRTVRMGSSTIDTNLVLDVKDLLPGTYAIRIQGNGTVRTSRFVKA